jgi:hypothetical protein
VTSPAANSVGPVTGRLATQTPASLARIALAPPWGRLVTQLTTGFVSSAAPSLATLMGSFSRAGSELAGGAPSLARSSGPSAPVSSPSGVGSGVGAGSGAGGGSGFFFFGAAVLFALAALFVPRLVGTLRLFGRSLAPDPFALLLERPG